MTRPTNSQPSSQELLERGRLTLQAIQYHERAARYKAAAASLQAAMVQAENGNAEKLREWLELESHQFDRDIDRLDPINERIESSEPKSPVRSLRIDPPDPTAQILSAEPVVAAQTEVMPSLDKLESPWSRMEVAAKTRLGVKCSSAMPSETVEDSLNRVISNDVTLDVSSNKASLNSPEFRDGMSEAELPAKPLLVAPDLATKKELSDELRISFADLDLEAGRHPSTPWWKAPHVWVSLFVHVILVVCLSIVAITVATEPKLLSIVSASVEAENVLLETPLEMISELETASEPMQSSPTPNLSDLMTDVSLPSVAVETGSMISPPPKASTAVTSSASESAQASMTGSKMLTGAEFFGVKATGNTFVYIVDSSPSMRRDGAFEAARNEIVRSLSSMKPKQRYFISFFGKEIDPMVFESGVVEKYPIYAKPENLTKTIDWLSRVQIQKEGLPPNNALTEAIGMQPDGIFLLFDGDTKVDVAKYLRRVNRSDDILTVGMPKVPIHVVHFFQDEFQKQMRQVAEENGGTYRFVPRPERPSKGNR